MPQLHIEFMKRLALVRGWIKRPQNAYLIIATIATGAFVVATPPFQGPDEEAHFVRLLYITEGYLVPVPVTKDSSVDLPVSVLNTVKLTHFKDDIKGDTNKKYETWRTGQALDLEYDDDKTYKPTMVPYSPIPYLPAVPLVAASNALNASPVVGLYAARFSLAITSVMILWLAIRVIPAKKYFMAAVGLLPMVAFQQAVVTADGVSYALLALFIAFILYLKARAAEDITTKHYVILVCLVILIALSKTLLYAFLPLALILWSKQGAKKWLATSAAAAILAIGAWTLATDQLITNPPGVDSAAQAGVLIERPLRWARVMWNSYTSPFGDGQVRGIVGSFGAADTVYPMWATVLVLIGLFASAILALDKTQVRLIVPRFIKLLTLLLIAGYFAAVNLAMYLNYSPVGFDIIYGVQGRYFIPLLIVLPLLLLSINARLEKRSTEKARSAILWCSAFALAFAVVIVFQRYYLYTP
jgi:uncharacterized membrane protein